MKSLLIVGGVLFILVSIALMIGAVVVFLLARSRRARAAQPAASASYAPVAPPTPPATHSTPAPTPEPVAVPPEDPNATIVVSLPNAPVRSLHGVSPNVAGRSVPIDQYGVYIGRDQKLSQVIVDSPDVSKRHVWVGLKDGVPVAIDQGSTNGTFLNAPGAVIREVRLKPGDTIIIANDTARFTVR